MAAALVVGNDGSIRRIITDKDSIAIGPTTAALDALLHRTRGNKGDFLRQELRCEGAPWCDVIDNPHTAPVGSKHKIIVARLHRKVTHRHRRKTAAFELRPCFSSIG